MISRKIKSLLLNTMEQQGITKAELSRRMKLPPQEITRITDLGHPTKVDTLALAFKVLGKRLTFTLESQ